MVKTVEKSEFIQKIDEILNDVKSNNNTYIITLNTIPFVKICPLEVQESKLGVGISYESAGLVGITEEY